MQEKINDINGCFTRGHLIINCSVTPPLVCTELLVNLKHRNLIEKDRANSTRGEFTLKLACIAKII